MLLPGLFAWATEKEDALARHLLQQLGQKYKIVETPDAVAALAQSLSVQGAIDVKTIESDQPLANSLPAGIVYISTALIQSATTAELAAILAHQIVHATERHGQITGRASIPLVFMGSSGGICMWGGDPALLVPLSIKPRLIANEADADLLAAHYLERAGYEAVEVQPIFDRLLRPTPAPRKTPTLTR